MDEHEYLEHDAVGLAALVAAGEVTPKALLEIARARAGRLNPALNAIVTRLDAHADARAAGPLDGPFAGVPFLIKDLNQDIEGEPSTSGSRALATHRAPVTTTAVQRWLGAGLVVLGRTATPEFGAKGITEARLHGPTRNPWDPSRTPGGSSGGSAAAVAAGIVPAAGASDGGGSIRIPAACCGLVGLKPSRGLVPAGPVDGESLHGLSTHGVVSRTVRDSAAMLDVLAGPEAVSPYAAAVPATALLEELEHAPAPLRIGFTTGSAIRTETHPEAVRAVEHAAALLAELGHGVEEVAPPHDDAQLARDFLTIWFTHQAAEVEQVKRLTGAGDDGFEQDTRVMAALGRGTSGVALSEALLRRREHTAALAAFHTTHDLLLTPTLGEPPIEVGSLEMPLPVRAITEALLRTGTTRVMQLAGVVDQIVDRNLRWVPYTQLANLTGRPAISLPLHWTPAGLPMGVQLVGRLGSESLLLRLARQLEQAAPWAERRPRVH